MNERVVILGAGFGGLELSTILSEAMGDEIDVALIDKGDAFVFGFSKLDLMFGRVGHLTESIRPPCRLSGVATSLEPVARRRPAKARRNPGTCRFVLPGFAPAPRKERGRTPPYLRKRPPTFRRGIETCSRGPAPGQY